MLFVQKKNHTNVAKNETFCKVMDHCKYRDVTYSICNLRFNVSYEIPVVLHNVSNYDYHFIIK